jgi:nucleotide-binding universal stress UspA family protein
MSHIIGSAVLAIDAGRVAARACAPAEVEEAPPESVALRRRVLITLCQDGPLHGVIQMGRLIAGAIHAPLHGLFLGPKPIEASEVAEHVGLAPEALHGLVLEVAAGDPGEALAAALTARAAAYVIVAAAPAGAPGDDLGVGHLAQRALEIAHGGVVILDPRAGAAQIRRILLPLDGTPSTASAITPAGELARRLGAELDILLVGEAHPRCERERARLPEEPGAMAPPQYVDQPHHEWAAFTEEFLHRFLGAFGHCPPDIATRFFLGAGEPGAEILRVAVAVESDLLVLVWHGKLCERHGAVFRDVLRGARCPVLVLRR